MTQGYTLSYWSFLPENLLVLLIKSWFKSSRMALCSLVHMVCVNSHVSSLEMASVPHGHQSLWCPVLSFFGLCQSLLFSALAFLPLNLPISSFLLSLYLNAYPNVSRT